MLRHTDVGLALGARKAPQAAGHENVAELAAWSRDQPADPGQRTTLSPAGATDPSVRAA